MTRLVVRASILGVLCACLLAGGPARADEEEPEGPARLASDEEVAEALAQFEVDFKARGIPKEDVVSQRNWAMKKIAKLHHPDIIKALGKVTKHRNKDLRTLALIYLGDQTLHPYLAAKPILAAMKKHKRDKSVLMTGLQSICLLKYLGARKEILALLNHKEFAVKKLAITTVGALEDIRMLKEILRLLGVDVDVTSSNREGTGAGEGPATDGASATGSNEGESGSDDGADDVEPGYSWDGVDVFVPEGEDSDAAVREAQEKNRSEAEAAARGSGSGSSSGGGSGAPATPAGAVGATPTPAGSSSDGPGSSDGSKRGSGKTGRGSKELVATILLALKKLTGQKFTEPAHIKFWLAENAKAVREMQQLLDKEEKAQKDAPKKAAARKKAEQEEAARASAGN